MEQSAGEALLEATQGGMSVLVKEGVANGRLLPSLVKSQGIEAPKHKHKLS